MKKKFLVVGSVLGGALTCLAEGSQATIADLGVTITDYMDSFTAALGTPLGKALATAFSIMALFVGYKLFRKFVLRA